MKARGMDLSRGFFETSQFTNVHIRLVSKPSNREKKYWTEGLRVAHERRVRGLIEVTDGR